MAKEYTREQVGSLANKLFCNGVSVTEIDDVVIRATGKNLDQFYAYATGIRLDEATELTSLAGGALNTLLVQKLSSMLVEASAQL